MSAGHDGTIKTWDAGAAMPWITFKAHAGGLAGWRSTRTAMRLASSAGRSSGQWCGTCARGLEEAAELDGPAGHVSNLAFSPDGKQAAFAGIAAGLDGDRRRDRPADVRGEGPQRGGPAAWAYSPDGGRIATAGRDGAVKVWDAHAGKELFTLDGHKGTVHAVAFSHDGKRIASAGDDGAVKVWDAEARRVVFTLDGHAAGAQCVAFSPDGTRIAAGSGMARLDVNVWWLHPAAVKVWDARTGEALLTLEGPRRLGGRPWRSAPTANASSVAAATGRRGSGTPSRARRRASCGGHRDAILRVLYHPDGRHVVTGGEDGTVRVWDVE